jgi:hypothetical protein
MTDSTTEVNSHKTTLNVRNTSNIRTSEFKFKHFFFFKFYFRSKKIF